MTDIDAILATGPFVTDNRDYAVIKLPPAAVVMAAGILAEVGDPFGVVILDKDEVTLIIQMELVQEFDGRFRDVTIADTLYRLITLDAALDHDLVGIMARISAKLAEAGISILPYGAYTRDHILVPSDRIDAAMQALATFKG